MTHMKGQRDTETDSHIDREAVPSPERMPDGSETLSATLTCPHPSNQC
jgi:hypothetical protein